MKTIKCRIYGCDSKVQALAGGDAEPGGYLPHGWKITRSPEKERAKDSRGKPTCPKHVGSNGLIENRMDRRRLYDDE
jgi:hypothetical protein